jgi:hypothetical protein
MSWFYQWPTGLSCFVFTTLIVVPSIIGLYIFKQTGFNNILCGGHNEIVGIFVGIISVFLGVIFSFIILTVWNNYITATLNAEKEAEALYLLYGILRSMPRTEIPRITVVDYIKYIINEEYPAMKTGGFPEKGSQLIELLKLEIYSYRPENTHETILYSESIDWLNEAITLRIDRYHSAVQGVYMVIWWVSIIQSILLIVMSWFINCKGAVHYILVFIISIYVAVSMFLILILSYPFEGYASISPLPFEIALRRIINPLNQT